MSKTFDLTTLNSNPRNPRKIGTKEMERLKKSVTEFSQMLALRPIVYDKQTMEVLGGNQRLTALLETGHTKVDSRWVVSSGDLTDEQKKRFVIADNASFGDWDFNSAGDFFSGIDLFDDFGIHVSQSIKFDDFAEQTDNQYAQDEVKKPPTVTTDGYVRLEVILTVLEKKDVLEAVNSYAKKHGVLQGNALHSLITDKK